MFPKQQVYEYLHEAKFTWNRFQTDFENFAKVATVKLNSTNTSTRVVARFAIWWEKALRDFGAAIITSTSGHAGQASARTQNRTSPSKM